MDEIANNFIIANGNSLGAIDNDDGSSYYYTHHNFFVYGSGGLKNDFEGHDNWWVSNIVAFPSGLMLHNGYGGTVGTPGQGILDGHEQKFINNFCLTEKASANYAKPICSGRGTTIMSGTRLFNPNGNATTDCGKSFDVGAVISAYTPTMADDAIAAAREVLWG